MPEPVSIQSEAVQRVLAQRDEEIRKRLERLGSGWAVGVRLKPDIPYPRPSNRDAGIVEMIFEYHEVETLDGKLPYGIAGFQYFQLREQP